MGRSMEGMEFESLYCGAFWGGGRGESEMPDCGISAGAITEEDVCGNEIDEGSSMSGSESDNSSTRACDMIRSGLGQLGGTISQVGSC
jgi:hypothetical protein